MTGHPNENDTGFYPGSAAPTPTQVMTDDELNACRCIDCEAEISRRASAGDQT